MYKHAKNELTLVIINGKYYAGKISHEENEIWLIDVVEFTVVIQQAGQIAIMGLFLGDLNLKENDPNIIYGVITKNSSFYKPYYHTSSNIQTNLKLN